MTKKQENKEQKKDNLKCLTNIRVSKDKKFIEESIFDYYLLLNYLMKHHSAVLTDFIFFVLKGRPIKSGMKV